MNGTAQHRKAVMDKRAVREQAEAEEHAKVRIRRACLFVDP